MKDLIDMKLIKQMPIVKKLLSSSNLTIQYKAYKLLLDEPEDSPKMLLLRQSIKKSMMAKRLLSHKKNDGTIDTHPYRKWQGPHWTLYSLAEIDYPYGDGSLLPMRDQVYNWLLDDKHLKYPQSLLIPGQEDRFRRCASQEGNAIWYSIKLGIDDKRTKLLVERLKKWQWPDGGWNCDKRPQARKSSVIESLIPLRALYLAGKTYNDNEALEYAERTVEYFLKRKLYRRLKDGKMILPHFDKIHYPIFFYDVLFALLVMAEIGKITDECCTEALGILQSKQLPDGGFPLELKNCKTSNNIITRGSFADWGEWGKQKTNPFVTVYALYVLKCAGKFGKA
jgi:hypothetical protein